MAVKTAHASKERRHFKKQRGYSLTRIEYKVMTRKAFVLRMKHIELNRASAQTTNHKPLYYSLTHIGVWYKISYQNHLNTKISRDLAAGFYRKKGEKRWIYAKPFYLKSIPH